MKHIIVNNKTFKILKESDDLNRKEVFENIMLKLISPEESEREMGKLFLKHISMDEFIKYSVEEYGDVLGVSGWSEEALFEGGGRELIEQIVWVAGWKPLVFEFRNETFQNNTIPKNINKFSNLEKIVIDDCNVKSIGGDNFFGLNNLHELVINNNDINNTPEHTFNGLTNLKKLDLAANRINEIADGVFSYCKNVEIIDLSFNRLNYIDVSTIKSLKKLKKLILTGNRFSTQFKDSIEYQIPNVSFF